MNPQRRNVVEAVLRDIARDIAWLEARVRREGDVSGWNKQQINSLIAQREKLEGERNGN